MCCEIPPSHSTSSCDTKIKNKDSRQDSDLPGPGACVLVVDDDFNTRQSLSRQLKAAGFRVCTAADGIEALSILDHQDVDVIVLDVRMPCMDGFEVCPATKRTRDTPVIILTGVQTQMIRECLPQMVDGAGADHYLRKPCDTMELIRLINRLLNRD